MYMHTPTYVQPPTCKIMHIVHSHEWGERERERGEGRGEREEGGERREGRRERYQVGLGSTLTLGH